MTYEELFNQTQDILISRGFHIDEDTATKVIQQQAGEVIVNGQRQIQIRNIKVKFCCLGEGSMNDAPLIGYKIIINNQDVVDEWIEYPETLIEILNRF
jgi:hypothetical protein